MALDDYHIDFVNTCYYDSSEMLPDGQKVGENGRNPENTCWIPVLWFPVHPVCEYGFDRVAHIATHHCSSRNRPKHRVLFEK